MYVTPLTVSILSLIGLGRQYSELITEIGVAMYHKQITVSTQLLLSIYFLLSSLLCYLQIVFYTCQVAECSVCKGSGRKVFKIGQESNLTWVERPGMPYPGFKLGSTSVKCNQICCNNHHILPCLRSIILLGKYIALVSQSAIS